MPTKNIIMAENINPSPTPVIPPAPPLNIVTRQQVENQFARVNKNIANDTSSVVAQSAPSTSSIVFVAIVGGIVVAASTLVSSSKVLPTVLGTLLVIILGAMIVKKNTTNPITQPSTTTNVNNRGLEKATYNGVKGTVSGCYHQWSTGTFCTAAGCQDVDCNKLTDFAFIN